MLLSLMSNLHEVFLSKSFHDQRVWTLDASGRFSAKSFFMDLIHGDEPQSFNSFPYAKIWKPPVPSWVNAILWTAALNCISTMDMLQKRRPFMQLSSHWCILCRANAESSSHLFLHCQFSKHI